MALDSRTALSRASLSPARALLHPAWLVSLALLALNDHVLKGAGVLPSFLTGKLSDFAGLMVAPLLLALALRVRSERSWRIAHVAVGVVFAAIQLSAPLAHAWAALMQGVGFTWIITRDPTDLVALPVLLLSWAWLGAAMQRPAAYHARSSVRTAVAGAGFFACAATSEPHPEPDPEPEPEMFPEEWQDDESGGEEWEDDGSGQWGPAFTAEAYLHNGTETDIIVRVRTLLDQVELDCGTIEQDPGRMLTSPLFDAAETWTVPRGANLPLGDEAGRGCNTALVEVDRLPPQIVFWRSGQLPPHQVQGGGSSPEDPGELGVFSRGSIDLEWLGAESYRYDMEEVEAECEEQPDSLRLAWSEPVPWGQWSLQELNVGYDGCHELVLRGVGGETANWFACLPEETMVAEVGDDLDIALPASGRGFAITVTEDGTPAIPERSVDASVWDVDPVGVPFLAAAVPDFDCGAEVQPTCGTVASPVHVSLSEAPFEAVELLPDGSVTTVEAEDRALVLSVMHGQLRHAVDPDCAHGPDTATLDLELVVARRPVEME